MAKEIPGVRQPDGGQTGCWEVIMEVVGGVFVAGVCVIGGWQLGGQIGKDFGGRLFWLLVAAGVGFAGVLALAWRGRVAFLIGYLMVMGVMGLVMSLCGARMFR